MAKTQNSLRLRVIFVGVSSLAYGTVMYICVQVLEKKARINTMNPRYNDSTNFVIKDVTIQLKLLLYIQNT